MTKQEFLSENREQVINYYNSKVKDLYNVSLKDFMLNLFNGFEKITTGEEFEKYDLFGNLEDAKSRLGLFSSNIKNTYSKPYGESNHAKAVAYHGEEKVKLMANA